MCDICEKHAGAYVRWYFNPSNFSDDLVRTDRSRAKVFEDIVAYRLEYYVYNATRLAKLASSACHSDG